MSRVGARALKRLALGTGYYHRRLENDRFSGVVVLCYHGVREAEATTLPFAPLHVTAGELEAHCRVVRDTCHPFSLSEWDAARRGAASLPPRPVVFTFDDGYRSVLRIAQPILERYEIPATVFIANGAVETSQLFWHDAVARQRGEAAVEAMKELPYETWRRTCDELAVTSREDEASPLSAMEISSLARCEGITIGGHTVSHAILSRAEPRQQLEEIRVNKAWLEDTTDGPVTAFAYPNGRPGIDYDETSVACVAEAGYRWGFTTRQEIAMPNARFLECSRFMMLAGISEAELAHRLSHSWRNIQGGPHLPNRRIEAHD